MKFLSTIRSSTDSVKVSESASSNTHNNSSHNVFGPGNRLWPAYQSKPSDTGITPPEHDK